MAEITKLAKFPTRTPQGENSVLVFGAHSTKILRIAHVLQEDSFLVESMIADARHIPSVDTQPIFLYKKLAQVLTHLRLRGLAPGKLRVRP